jgi:D-alanyl-D-alanine carboxypeptidase/D-alanyl-D-alanine-endopeptidase (penicillin-binding protein 4)
MTLTYRILAPIVVTLGCVAMAQSTDTTRTVPQLRTGIPSAYDSAQSVKLLGKRLLSLLRGPGMRGADVSAAVVSVKTGETLFELNSTRPLTPASTSKLFSTAAAFYFYGKGATVNTEVLFDGTLAGGVITGNVYLVGNGDAMLTTPDLEYLADRIRAAGVRRITGNIVGDGFRFDDDPERSRYSGDGEVVQPLPPITALTVNDGVVTVVVSNVGGHVRAQTIPTSSTLAVTVLGTKGRCSIQLSTTPDGYTTFIVSGRPPLGRTLSRSFTMPKPALTAAGIFASRLASGGITIDGQVVEQSAPSGTTLLAVFRRPLTDIASVVNKRSHNYLAEHCYMMVGAHCGEYARTAARAKRAIVEVLDSLHVPQYGVVMNDGSGLSRRNRSSAATQVHLLRSAFLQSWGPEWRSTLAIAGRDGSLRGRMIGTPAENNCVGKTGTLRNVSALSGFVRAADGTDLAFAVISNGPAVRTYKAVENHVAVTLAQFRYDATTGDTTTIVEFDETIDGEDEGVVVTTAPPTRPAVSTSRNVSERKHRKHIARTPQQLRKAKRSSKQTATAPTSKRKRRR